MVQVARGGTCKTRASCKAFLKSCFEENKAKVETQELMGGAFSSLFPLLVAS